MFAKNAAILPTITGKGSIYDFDTGHVVSVDTFIKAGTLPKDYNFCNSKPHYIIGMSVPPVMMAHIAVKIYEQWLKYIN